MEQALGSTSPHRYHTVTKEKSTGATYTPKVLADFVAEQIVKVASKQTLRGKLRVLDPAIGHGELLLSLLEKLKNQTELTVEIFGFETDASALQIATDKLRQHFPHVSLNFQTCDFLDYVLDNFNTRGNRCLLHGTNSEAYDLIIANPPYVRTQIIGSSQAQKIARNFGLSGRVDLYYAFIVGISHVIKPEGVAGIIVSNRFMTTKSGKSVRQALNEGFNIQHAWDLGDTKIFDAAVLPAVLLVEGKSSTKSKTPKFTSIYQTTNPPREKCTDPISALSKEGAVETNDGRYFQVEHGKLSTDGSPDGVWRIANESTESWLAKVDSRTWGTFRDIGKIRVGIKTCADKIYIRNDWQERQEANRPELLKFITTHHIARRFKPLVLDRRNQVLYTHETKFGRRCAVDLSLYPQSKSYLEIHRPILERRKYVLDAGREWYEIWVPQDPSFWCHPKLVFRDITEEPTFWIDLEGTIVNGDCYWLACQKNTDEDLLWLAVAIGNSTFIERFYDLRFNNKLYAGRRRFITQYVENFPLPNPNNKLSKNIIATAKQVYKTTPSPESVILQKRLDSMVWESLAGSDFK